MHNKPIYGGKIKAEHGNRGNISWCIPEIRGQRNQCTLRCRAGYGSFSAHLPSFEKIYATASVIVFILLLSGCGGNDKASPVDCSIDAGPCVKETNEKSVKVTFDINPKPVAAMKRLVFTVRLEKGASAVTDAEVFAGLSMPGMYMNENRVRLTHTADGLYTGEGVIVRCASGKKVWKADVSVRRHGSRDSGPLRTSFCFRVNR